MTIQTTIPREIKARQSDLFLDEKCIDVNKLAVEALENERIAENSYFSQLKDGAMTLEQFRWSQRQFYFAVNYYSQPIAVLFSRLANPAHRMRLLGNLMDEHGNINMDKCHSATFKKFLASINCDIDDIETELPGPEVQAFNSALMGVCAHESPEMAAAMLGVIELAFSSISATIADGVIHRGWVDMSDLSHYSLHSRLDIEHATVLLELAQQVASNNHDSDINRGLTFGAYIFNRLYTDLCNRYIRTL